MGRTSGSRPLLEREWIVKIKQFGVLGLQLLVLASAGLSSKVEAQQKVVIYSSNDDTLAQAGVHGLHRRRPASPSSPSRPARVSL